MGAGVAWVVGALWGVFLLCRRGQGEDQVPGLDGSIPARCGPEQFLHQEANVLLCCPCKSSTRPCPSHELRGCTCATPGEFCEDSDCKSCKKHNCSPGQQAVLLGNFLFALRCKDCKDGTYSDGIDGKCLPWTDCGREGFLTVRPGNRTHNTLCGMAPLPGSGSGLSNSYSVPVAILTGLAAITFMLVIIQLVLHIWWVKKEPFIKDRESILPLGPGPPDDIGNCPFPEEEWGEKTAEDKAQMGHPWV
ncbi:tumor necrosis factor receptor superfamily member 18 [Trichosurus vulpecula]|uniref:tumor necrosis factor receptor superfamily member 18 n=1 Tax=Trichosurus vulpecula TaxID=9337 RepID=UPI00186B4814|nr:tumor necrosis factor receptor superfamily member 18 [Trichosurus vulpecula]